MDIMSTTELQRTFYAMVGGSKKSVVPPILVIRASRFQQNHEQKVLPIKVKLGRLSENFLG